MVNQELLDHIAQKLAEGTSEGEIKSSLRAAGWQESDVHEAFRTAPGGQLIPQSPTVPHGVTSLPGATALLRHAWSLYNQRLGTLLGIMIIPTAVTVGLVALLAGGGILGTTLLPSQFAVGGIGLLLLLLLAVVAVLAILISQAWGQIALLYAIKDSQEGIGVKEAYRRGWSKMASFYWASLLVGFITVGGFLLFIVPGVIFAGWFSFAVFIVVAEDLKGMNALLKSREYVRGKWWAVFWRILFIGVVAFIISLVPAILFSFLQIPFAAEFSRFIIGLFLTPLAMAYSFLLYSNLRAMKSETAFTPTTGKKSVFIFAGVLGVVLIPIILFLTVFVSLGAAKGKALDARREADIRKIQLGLGLYHDEHGSYPASLDALSPQYLDTLPLDPKNNTGYRYQLQSDSNYKVCAQLETKGQVCVSPQ